MKERTDEAAHTHSSPRLGRTDGEEAAAAAEKQERMQSGFNSRAGMENQGIIGKRRRGGKRDAREEEEEDEEEEEEG